MRIERSELPMLHAAQEERSGKRMILNMLAKRLIRVWTRNAAAGRSVS